MAPECGHEFNAVFDPHIGTLGAAVEHRREHRRSLPSSDAAERERIGEVPTVTPTVAAQILAAKKARLSPDLVILGGINDVGVLQLVVPHKIVGDVRARTESFGGYMRELVRYAAASFRDAKFVVLDYYPIVSADTDFGRLLHFGRPLFHHCALAALTDKKALPHEIDDLVMQTLNASPERVVGALGVTQHLVSLSQAFHGAMTDALRTDVEALSARNVSVALATAPWADAHSVFASQPWLWELDLLLRPVDPLSEVRSQICTAGSPVDPITKTLERNLLRKKGVKRATTYYAT